MTILDGLYWTACAVLVVSGVGKLAEPAATGRTLADLGLSGLGGPWVGRVVGGVEVVIGAAGLTLSGAPARVAAGAVALLYAAFCLVVVAALRRGLEDCGCIGARPSRPSASHAAADGALAAVGAVAALVGPSGLADGLDDVGVAAAVGIGLGVAVAAGAFVAWESRGAG